MDQRTIETFYPVSPLQQGLIYHSLLEPESGAYVQQFGCTIEGTLNPALFEEAWNRIIARHSVLRTAFVVDGVKEFIQVVNKKVVMLLDFTDLSTYSESEQVKLVNNYLENDRVQGFQLTKAPLMRMKLFLLSPNLYKVIWTCHHVLLDGWSMPIVFREFSLFYESLSTGKELFLAKALPYKDYIVWMKKQDYNAAAVYWKGVLGSFQAPTPLVIDVTAKSQERRLQYDEEILVLTETLSESVQQFSRQNQVTVNTMIQGAWAFLLGGYSGEKDVLFGVTVSGRPTDLDGAEEMVGMFINTLPLRVTMEPQCKVVDWLHEIQKANLSMRQYEYCPLVDIQGYSGVPRGISLFESIFVYENFPLNHTSNENHQEVEEGSLRIGSVFTKEQTNYPLTLVAASGSRMTLSLMYDASRFGKWIIVNMLKQLEMLLETMVKARECKLFDLPLCTESDAELVLKMWNNTGVLYPPEDTFVSVFQKQAESHHDALAVVDSKRSLTYRELDVKANQLSNQLNESGVTSGDIIGVMMNRSCEAIISIMAIMKAGAAYLPIDPQYPPNRVSYMIENSRAKYVIISPEIEYSALQQASILIYNEESLQEYDITNSRLKSSPEDVAYLIYTSGTTGEPKGVMVEHRNLLNIGFAWKQEYKLEEMPVKVLQLASLSFDVFTGDLIRALMNGGQLVICPDDVRIDIPALYEWISNHQITHMEYTPSVLLPLMEYVYTHDLNIAHLKLLILGSDNLQMSDYRLLWERFSEKMRIINSYGVTEACIDSSYYEPTEAWEMPESGKTPIGKPLPNVKMYILDSARKLLPPGMKGELFIGGSGVSRGYIYDEALTSAKFVDNPFVTGEKMYRTGDLAKWLPDGQIEFHGRSDYQIKLRGFRIELGEIEAQFLAHKGIRQVLVDARPDNDGKAVLVAYVVLESEVKLGAQEIKRVLKNKLPDYMIPQYIMFLDNFPLTPNGKVDRKGLAPPNIAQEQDLEFYIAPRTPEEEIAANIWAQVLGLDKVGVRDHFFELGGHSLLVSQAVSRMNDTFKKQIPLRALFENPLLEEWVSQYTSDDDDVVIEIIPKMRPDRIPLSIAQRRLWFLEKYSPGSGVYNVPDVYSLEGNWQIDRLENSLREIVKRHEILRTSFDEDQYEPAQLIRSLEPVLITHDLRELPQEDKHNQLLLLMLQEIEKPIELMEAPLFRMHLYQTEENNYVLLLLFHHIIYDGWSSGVLLRELLHLYQSYDQTEVIALPSLALQYADYAIWQQEWLSEERIQEQLAYWKQHLEGAAPLLQLPTDRPRPSVQTYNGSFLTFSLPSGIQEELARLSRQEGTTLFMTLLAAYYLLLYRYTQQEDIVVGTPISGRNHQKFEQMIGFFVNTIVFRVDLSKNPTYKQLLKQVKEVALGAYSNQDVPFERVVEELQPERSVSYSPVFQTMFILQNNVKETIELDGSRLYPYPLSNIEGRFAKFDLTLTVVEGENGLGATFEYNTDLFDKLSIQRMAEHFKFILSSISHNPKCTATDLPLIKEEIEWMERWNETAVEYPRNKAIHDLFEMQVVRMGEKTAIVHGAQTVTYAELNRKANRIANYLCKNGIKQQELVGIYMEKSIDTIAAILGVWKAGAAYVPLDPEYPMERLTYILQDTDVRVVLTMKHLAWQMPLEGKAFCLDQVVELILDEDERNPSVAVAADHLAYVMYTSGSTGSPKGVMVEHTGVVNLAIAQSRQFGVDTSSKVLQFASLNFDASVSEIVMTLLSGAQLCLPPRERSLSGSLLINYMNEQEITTVTLPSVLLNTMDGESLPYLKSLIVAGDVCTASIVNRWTEGRVIHNAYGPTEATVCATIHLCESNGINPPIGKPMANTQIYILDRTLKRVPVGAIGEIFIGGVGVARGYLNQDELTSERFIANPYGKKPSGRLYRTGDLGRFLKDGTIQFVGRSDYQVKIRGYRIELGEIEAVLQNEPSVKDAAVIVRDDITGEKQIVGYYVSVPDGTMSQEQMKTILKRQLPNHMIPSHLINLDVMPLTSNGKLDRKALAEIPVRRMETERGYEQPRTTNEILLKQIWEQVLGVEDIGTHDNFFELGGDSILSIQIVSRANQAGVLITPKQLFENQTIAELSSVAGQKETIAEQGLVAGVMPLIPIQKWFFEQKLNRPHHWNQSVLLNFIDRPDPSQVHAAVCELLRHHDNLRVIFNLIGEERQAVIRNEVADQSFEYEDWSGISDSLIDERLKEATNQAQQRLDYENGPVMKLYYFDLGERRDSKLYWVIHHLAVDGVSWRILMEDFQTLLSQSQKGQTLQLPKKTTSYLEWAKQVSDYAGRMTLSEEQAYWLREDWKEVPNLPVDFPGGDNTERSVCHVTLSLSSDETRQLIKKTPAVYRTHTNDLLLAALARTIREWTGFNRVAVQMEGHGREFIHDQLDVSRTVGWFTTLYPVLLNSDPSLTDGELIKSIKEDLRSIPLNGFGYGLLRYMRTEGESLRQLPSPGIIFNHLGQIDGAIEQNPMYQTAKEQTASNTNADEVRPYPLEISMLVAGGQLHVTWSYSGGIYKRSTIDRLALEYMDHLHGLIAHCLSEEAGGYTPSDFPLATVNQFQLDRIHAQDRYVDELYPLTPMQQGMVYHSLYDKYKGDYVVQFDWAFKGGLNIQAFEEAWRMVVERFDTFRSYVLADGLVQIHQAIRKQVEVHIRLKDLRGKTSEEREAAIESYRRDDRAEGFDLSEPPLMRWALFQTNEEDFHFVWSHHHILLDGWSLPIVMKDLFTFYESAIRNQEIAIATSPPFSNYIRWLKNQDRRAAEIFWRAELEGFRYPTPIRIKSGIPSSERGHLYEERRLFITKDMTERLNEFVRNNQLTMNTLLQGAWALLLSRYSDEDDVLFGATVSGRPADLADVEQMVGPFINTLPVRVCLTNQFTVLDWLKQLQTKQNNLRQFEYCSILDIQGWSEVPRGVPLFESLFVFENYPVDPTAIEKMENNKEMIIESFQGKEQTGYPLSFVAAPGSQLSLGLMYDAGIYDSKMAEGILQHYVKGLEEVLDRPQGLLSEIDILPEAEREKLDQWNGTEIPIPDLSIYEMFERQAEFYPNSIALVHGEEEMSYGELKRRSTILAGMLLAEGARMEDLIGISMNRSIDAIVSILGVLKAGCAYVPIDPTYPKHRIGYILQDTKLGIILTQKHLSESFTDQGLCVICTDEIEYELDDSCYAISWKKANPDQLAYVIYTSGSTGLPKGVKIEHRGVVNMALAQIERFGVTAESRVLQFASMNFDASVSEMVMALFSGARLYLADQETLSSPKMLLDLLRQQAITTITLPSAYLFHLEPSDLPSLQTLIVAGDVCQAELVTLWGQDRAFFNAYGPTEASVCATIYRCSDARDPLPIGIPIWNTKLFVLDKWGRRTPIGVPGELFISGPGLARGYLNLEEATDDKFLPSPFKDGGRLYRTGDQVCYLDDGNMVFLGRMDSQVKIRGFRVELNEVEDMIRLIPGIEEATVIVTDYGNADKRIIAFYTSQAKVNLSPDELRIQLQNRLPHYMIPSLYLRLDQMPLNESGKIDKKSLAQTEMEEWNDTVPYQEPQTPLEKDMAEIWSEILKVGPIGLRSQFFDLGGHSLHALSVISQVREKYSLDVPIKSLFDYPVLEEWANYLESVLENGLSQRLPSIMKAEGHEEAPLSFSQQRMWFIDQLLPASSLYNAPLGLVLEGELDIGALQRSIDGLIKRHESLRTVFVNKSGHPLQRVTEPFSLPIRSVNLNIAGNGETDQEWERTCVELCSTPFNLSEGPLIRAGLCRITEDRHVLLLIMHHIVSDGWSVGVLIRDLLVMYRANSSRGNLELPELPIQYADYAIWQRKWLEKDLLKNQLKYWLEQLHDAAPMLQLPTDRPRPVVQSNRGDIVTSLVPERVTQKLKELCHTEGTTLYMTLLTVFNVLLYRYTGQEDILIGSPVAGRKDSKLENLIGLFVNTLVLRTNVSGDSTFRELLSRVKKVTLDAFTHQDLPFEKIVDDLQLERSLQYSPLFQVMFVLQNTELSMNEEVPGLQVYPMDVDLPDSKGAKYDLTLTMTESSQGIHASLEFNIDLFDRSTAERMLEHLLMIAHSAVEDPEKRIADMNLLSDHERELIEQWNETNWRDFEEAECVHRLFERQAYIQPDSIALLFGEEHLTYSQLNDKANRIAQLLSSLGAGPESLVGLCMDRSPDMVAGLLGIMKSGAAYVPLDPKYPTERLRYMMEDSNISLILTDRNAELKLNLDGLTILPMDDVNSHDANQCGNLSVPVTPSNLAYIIYTSGSTGKPKGVAIEHKSVFGLIQWAKETYQQDIFKGSLFSTSICFDLSVFELFVPLCVGGRVILEENILSLLESPVAGEVTIINTVPSATIELLRVNAIPPSVNVVNLAGEALPVTLVEQLYATGTVQKVFNLYGPTEDTTYSTYELVERGCVPTIGKSLPNSTTYILDSNLHRVPIGVPGELYLGGDGLARCYWNKEELTAERFIRNRFSNGRDDRLYRTGDIARYLQDGSIQYLGRLDNQVKVRGFRVELGEVEEVLRAYPSVRNAAAIVREGEQGNKQIVAYLETEPDLDTDTLLIRSYSQEKLPNYMIPAVFIVMDRLPLTPNGKINRKMLPLSIGVTEGNTVAYVPPRSEREKSLADVWSRVLRIQLIGMNDNFFGLGGDSLLVIQVVAKAFESGIQITPKQMFEHQTISELAKVSVLLSESNETEVILTGEMPLTPIQHWFFEQQHEDFHHWNQSIMLEIKTSVNQKLLEKCIQHLLLQHDILRVRFEQRDGEWIQYYAEEHPQAVLEVIDVSALASEEQQQAIEKRSDKVQRSLDITAGPIMRFVYFDLGEKNGRLLIIAHHLVVDVVSWRLIIEDIMRTYAKLSNHEEIRILPKSTSYQEWTTLLSRLAREDQTLREMEFWMNQLRGGFSLPKQFDNGSNTQADVAHVSATLSEEDTSKLFKLPQMMDTHINDWLLTALMLTIREWTGNEEITVHFEGHGRNEELGQRINLTRTVGWFTSMYPLKLRLGEADNYLEVVLHVSGLLKSVPNSGINYGLLRYLSEEQIRARFEIEAHPQICFNYFGQVDQLIEENSLFGFARESVGQTVSEKAVRTHLLDISCLVSNGRLTMNWLFSRNHYGKEFVEGIALRYMHYLQSVLQYGHLKTLEKDQIIL